MKRTTGSTDSTMVEVKTRGGVQKMGEIDDLGGYLTSRLTKGDLSKKRKEAGESVLSKESPLDSTKTSPVVMMLAVIGSSGRSTSMKSLVQTQTLTAARRIRLHWVHLVVDQPFIWQISILSLALWSSLPSV